MSQTVHQPADWHHQAVLGLHPGRDRLEVRPGGHQLNGAGGRRVPLPGLGRRSAAVSRSGCSVAAWPCRRPRRSIGLPPPSSGTIQVAVPTATPVLRKVATETYFLARSSVRRCCQSSASPLQCDLRERDLRLVRGRTPKPVKDTSSPGICQAGSGSHRGDETEAAAVFLVGANAAAVSSSPAASAARPSLRGLSASAACQKWDRSMPTASSVASPCSAGRAQ